MGILRSWCHDNEENPTLFVGNFYKLYYKILAILIKPYSGLYHLEIKQREENCKVQNSLTPILSTATHWPAK